ncbi:MAG: CDP-alcohol phosphatidyltransferase family protein [Nitrospinae bacterium]|nr:CDP-alcohol phosphatidyltransferase family protein [Nitrospinota bacterium]MZH03901.1 CDP-alcohol phosphatidyltransferase family protein [Nitrospinota bacterium]MZH14436.1 CDP-alcohol phosphatidyltransferase family protein [Nitrospinota bacterium]
MKQEILNSPGDFQKLEVILYLPSSLDPEWYMKNIAGVPFLLRNLLVLQKQGIEKLAIFSEESMKESLELFLRQINADPRLKLCINHEGSLSYFQNKSSLLFINGSKLVDDSSLKNRIVPGNLNNLSFISEKQEQLLKDHELFVLRSNKSEPSNNLQNEKDFQEAEDALLESCGLNNDSLLDRLVTRFVSRRLTGVFLDTSLTPNQITLLSMFVGLVAAFCFYKGTYEMGVLGSTLLLGSHWIDCVDGEVARLKFLVTEWGAKLDIFADNIVHIMVFFSIGMGLYYSTGEAIFKYLGILAVLGSLVSFIFLSKTIIGKKAEATQKINPGGEKDIADQLANRDFIYFLFVLALFGRLDGFIFLAAIGSNIFALFIIGRVLRARST